MDRRLACGSLFPNLFFSIGFSPSFVKVENWREIVEKETDARVRNEKVVAIGESGLDYFRNYGNREEQRELFELQLDLAVRYGLPVLIHNRDADRDVYDILCRYRGRVKGVMHCFSGDLTYKKSYQIRETAGIIPLERLFLETDSPYLAPLPHRGKTNPPLFIALLYSYLAELRKQPVELISAQVEKNFIGLFLKKREG